MWTKLTHARREAPFANSSVSGSWLSQTHTAPPGPAPHCLRPGTVPGVGDKQAGGLLQAAEDPPPPEKQVRPSGLLLRPRPLPPPWGPWARSRPLPMARAGTPSRAPVQGRAPVGPESLGQWPCEVAAKEGSCHQPTLCGRGPGSRGGPWRLHCVGERTVVEVRGTPPHVAALRQRRGHTAASGGGRERWSPGSPGGAGRAPRRGPSKTSARPCASAGSGHSRKLGGVGTDQLEAPADPCPRATLGPPP